MPNQFSPPAERFPFACVSDTVKTLADMEWDVKRGILVFHHQEEAEQGGCIFHAIQENLKSSEFMDFNLHILDLELPLVTWQHGNERLGVICYKISNNLAHFYTKVYIRGRHCASVVFLTVDMTRDGITQHDFNLIVETIHTFLSNT